jgi:hypothetical protein
MHPAFLSADIPLQSLSQNERRLGDEGKSEKVAYSLDVAPHSMTLAIPMISTASPGLSWFDASAEIKALLTQAADCWHDTARSKQYIERAIALGNDNPNVLIAAYRYFFYKNDGEMALWVAQVVMGQVRQVEGLPQSWEELQPILLARKDEPMMRLYLHAYAASGLLLAKLGDVDGALAIATHIKAIDDQREFGGDFLYSILTTPLDDDDD